MSAPNRSSSNGSSVIAKYGSPLEKQRTNPPPWRLSAARRPAPEERLSLDTVDLHQMEEDVLSFGGGDSDSGDDEWVQENAEVLDALRLAKAHSLSDARDVAETTLHYNPANSAALCVTATECEARQDWSEAARFFLVGLGHNNSDSNMEQGFQTNVDMLRAQRRRNLDRATRNKWEDVISFKPSGGADRPPSPEEKPPWYRLGPVLEEIVAEPTCHIRDLIETQQDPEAERMALRRIIYENLPFLNRVYTYYAQDRNEMIDGEDALVGQVAHDGHDPHDDEEGVLRLHGFWRLLKECKIAMGNVKVKMPVAVFDRTHVQGKRRVMRLQQDI